MTRQQDAPNNVAPRGRLRARAALWSILLLGLAAAQPGCSSDDPDLAQGETGGDSSTGGEQESGGSETSGGGGFETGGSPDTGGDGGGDPSGGYGGMDNTGGSPDTGGSPNTGGKPNTGGTPYTGGKPNTGGSPNTGGKPNTGGTPNTGGKPNTGGSPNTGGGPNTGGVPNSGGSGSGGGGSGGTGTGGSGGGGGNVQVTDNVSRAGINCIKVHTPSADYYYDKAGAGLVSLVDKGGKDWVSYKAGGGPNGEFRGIPNMGSCCHPGYTGATTSIVSTTADRAEVRSTGSGWELRWEFFADKARLTVVDAPGTYFLLYEGTPGGSLGAEDYLGRPDGSLVPLLSTEIYGDFANPEWTYFLDDNLGRALIVKHGQDDGIADTYWTYESMTVLGYGRTCKGGCTGMTASGQTLVLAFTDNTDPPAVITLGNALN